MVGPNKGAPVEQHAHEHEYRREPQTVYFEDGAFILVYDCLYSEGKTYTDTARDETYYDERYTCEETKQERLDLTRVSVVNNSGESERTTVIGQAPPDERPLTEEHMQTGRMNTGMPTEDLRQLTFEAENLLAADLPGNNVEVEGGLYAAERINTKNVTINWADQNRVEADVTLPASWVANTTDVEQELTIRLEYGNPE